MNGAHSAFTQMAQKLITLTNYRNRRYIEHSMSWIQLENARRITIEMPSHETDRIVVGLVDLCKCYLMVNHDNTRNALCMNMQTKIDQRHDTFLACWELSSKHAAGSNVSLY